MLETKDLCKTYTPKKGQPVMAVDHISLRFPEKGMVFLLGKSGSGKSTMLNLLGGLDQYDDGEIIIKGISSKDFTQQHFDSYRNTYVGFIFQEYNVLEEFTVGANIALALELQGRTASDEEINRILHDVDLDGFGKRKPNELSGGQKQRVAIARALVKNPEIIMADEPTGALDSNTGRQVLDLLKKLSAEKLVIIVSHDREYAEQYADRIIELADGKVIRDVEAQREDSGKTEKHLIYRASTIEIPMDYRLTEEDRIQINEYLDKLKSGASVTLPGKTQQFRDTDTSRIPVQDGSAFNLIRSKLPMRSAFQIGCSSLKHKRFRLVMTILLSVAAFTLFSLVDTFSAYNHIRACTDSLIDTDVNYVSVNKALKQGSGLNTWWTTYGQRISEEELRQLSEDTGLPMQGIFIPKGADLSFMGQYDPEYKFTESEFVINLRHFCGFAEITEQSAEQMGFTLTAGSFPDGSKNEIAVSETLCETFMKAGYLAPPEEDAEFPAKPAYEKISSSADMVGKVIRLMGTDYTVSGVLDTKFDLHRYDRLLESAAHLSTSEELVNYMLFSEYSVTANYSMTGCAMVGSGKIAEMVQNDPDIYEAPHGDVSLYYESDMIWGGIWSSYYTTLSRIPETEIVWTDGRKDRLNEDEVIISLSNVDIDGNGIDTALDLAHSLLNGEMELTPEAIHSLTDALDTAGTWNLNYFNYENDDYQSEYYENAKIVGIVRPDSPYARATVIADRFADALIGEMDGVYDSAVGPMPESRSGIEKFVRFCYRDGEDVTMRYEMNHAVTYELDTIHSVLKVLAKIFLYVGIAFAVFAALLMANFISTSIHYKRQEIGILRAIGSRSGDVFSIFFSESFVIAMINFVISFILSGVGVAVINLVLREKVGILVTVLHFGIRQFLLLLVISVGIAAIASFLPVRKIAAKKPIDAIRDR